MKVNIDLGTEREVYGNPVASSPASDSEVYYPSFYIESEEPIDLPKEGTMTIKFNRKSKTESEADDGEDKYCFCIEVQKIVEVTGSEPSATTKSYDDASSALDAIAAALSKG